MLKMLSSMNCSMKIRLSRYEGSHMVDRLVETWDDASGMTSEVAFDNATWQCRFQATKVSGRQDAIDLVARFKVAEGSPFRTDFKRFSVFS